MICWHSMGLLAGVRSVLVLQNVGTLGAFDQTWDVYRSGFGDLEDNFWIGNENLHQMTKNGGCKLRFDVWPVGTGSIWLWTEYSQFVIGDEASGYLLKYSACIGGNLGDNLYLNGGQFSTKDRPPSPNYISGWQCGFWFAPYYWVKINCYQSNFVIFTSVINQWVYLQQSRMSLFCQ